MGTLRTLTLVAALGLAGPALAQDDEAPAPEAPAAKADAPGDDADSADATADAKPAKAMKYRKDYIFDRGIQNDPYTHMRGLTEGRIEDFRELYVDPDAFAKSLSPKTPIRPAKLDSIELPEGASDEGYLAFDAKAAGDLEPAAVKTAIEKAGHTVREQTDEGLAFTVGEAGWEGLMNLTLRDGGRFVRIVDLGAISAEFAAAEAPEPEPEAEAAAEPDAAEGEGEAVAEAPAPERKPVGYAPKKLAAAGSSAVLPVDNARSSWAEVTINGEKVGIIGPYATGYVHDVKPGAYEIGFTWANGFSLTKTAETMAAPDPLPRNPGITPIGMPAPGVPAK